FNKVWEHWLGNIRPWCISRQLWWGHRIPVYYIEGSNEADFVVAKSEAEAYAIAQEKYGQDVKLRQDPDVLDTWFSSGLWPFSTLGWPDDTADLRRFYPTTVMETGYDIIFFWVARMVMQGLLFTNDIPFETIYLHGLVRDEHGKKMSKSTGNVIDPLEVTANYGTDALRFTLLTGGSPGNDMNLAVSKVESNRNFANKIWNVARFIVANLGKAEEGKREKGKGEKEELTAADVWILTRLREVTGQANRLLDAFNFGEAGGQGYDFLWGEFADWYIEIAKVQLNESASRAYMTLSVLQRVLDDGLRLLHPFIPFVTEETWQQLKAAFVASGLGIAPKGGWPEALIIADWPQSREVSEGQRGISAEFTRLQELISKIRAARAEAKVPPSKRIAATIVAGEKVKFARSQAGVIAALARIDSDNLAIVATADAPSNAVTISLGDYTIYLPLAGMVDLEKEKARLEKEAVNMAKEIKRLTGLLNSPFAQKAPAAVVQKEKDKLALLEKSSAEIAQRLAVM
ncbi:MAG TPA: valine--tRNA ligase, partial [Anaerolineae bacterium]|nr:valine--tRNA ligase [Anaerolineae bacterium]